MAMMTTPRLVFGASFSSSPASFPGLSSGVSGRATQAAAVAATARFFFAASDLVDDPGLEHGMTCSLWLA